MSRRTCGCEMRAQATVGQGADSPRGQKPPGDSRAIEQQWTLPGDPAARKIRRPADARE
jgi:hypothetical protein